MNDMAASTDLKWKSAKTADQASMVNNSLTIQLNGSSQGAYNGSAAKTVNITPSSIGAAASDHNHSASDITSGTLPVSRGGTGITANPSMLTNLSSTTAAGVFQTSPRPGITGTLAVAHGGTGSTSASAARTALGAAASDHTHNEYFSYMGEANTDTALNNAKTKGFYTLNGGTYEAMNGGKWWGWMQVWATPNNTANGCVNQMISADRHIYIRQWSGNPATWSNWYRVGSPVPVIDGDYGNQTINSGYAWKSAVTTIPWSGWHLIYGCAYSNDSGMETDYGVFQATVDVGNSPWLLGNQTLNKAIGKPGVGGTIYMYLEKGTQIALRIYYMASHGKPIHVGYTWFKVFRFS